MIRYDNKQHALRMIWNVHGSVLPRTLLPAFCAGVLTFLFAVDTCANGNATADANCQRQWIAEIQHPFAVQVFALVLGYVIVFRTNMALNRYRDGMTNIQLMTSKWGDAFMQLKAFCATEKATCSEEAIKKIDTFLVQNLHYFTLLDGLAMCVLRGEETGLNRFTYGGKPVSRHGMPEDEVDYTPQTGPDAIAKLKDPPADVPKFRVVGYVTEREARELAEAPDMVLYVAQWISESVSIMHVENTLTIPGPILSRFYQEMSNGMLGFNQAFKITFVPFPFPFAQILGILLVLFVFICPLMVAQMTRGRIIPPVLSFAAILGYWGLNQIAVELENPFGDDPNDLPLPETHDTFVNSLEEAYLSPPRPVNVRKPQPPPQIDEAVKILNDELQEQGVQERFSTKLNIRCLSVFGLADLEKKFGGNTQLAERMLRRIRDLVSAKGFDAADTKKTI
jgi:predicted membrane chloride channel (bestrophin family)